MVDYQTISIVLTGLGLMIALIYYSMQIRNQNKTRQAQLFMQIYDRWLDPDFLRYYVRSYKMEYEDLDDFNEKYSSREKLEERLPYTMRARNKGYPDITYNR